MNDILNNDKINYSKKENLFTMKILHNYRWQEEESFSVSIANQSELQQGKTWRATYSECMCRIFMSPTSADYVDTSLSRPGNLLGIPRTWKTISIKGKPAEISVMNLDIW